MNLSEIKPQFVLVMGGAGSGKSHFVATNPVYSKYQLVDVDIIKKEIGDAKAIMQVIPTLQAAFEKHENVAHTTMGVNLPAQKKKINMAHQQGYNVTLVFIDTPPDRAVDQVRQRVRQGGHDVPIDNVVSSNRKSRENFDALSALADETKII